VVKYTLNQFESIGESYTAVLKDKLGIKYVDDFYKYSLEEIKEKTQIEESRIKQFSEVLEIFKIPGLTIRNAELLNFININSIEELSHQQAIRIFYKMKSVDASTYLIILELPTFAQIDKWIYHAKLMTKRIKLGFNVPLILLPMINLDIASELQKYSIITIENFLSRSKLIPNLRRRIGMSKKDYRDLCEFITLVEVDGIDLYFAKIFYAAGIKSVKELVQMNTSDIVQRIKPIQSKEKEVMEVITEEVVEEIKNNIKGGH
jgi:hypothetical protein